MVSFSQDTSGKKAAKLFSKKKYLEAAKEYEKLGATSKTLSNLADCYYYKNLNKEAVVSYEKLFQLNKDSIQKDSYYRASQAFMKLKDYNKADPMMSNYLDKKVVTNNFIYELKTLVDYNYDIQLMTKSNLFSSYGMSSLGDQIVYASSKSEAETSSGMLNLPNYDFYIADINKAGLVFQSDLFSKDLNSKFHESSPSFSSDGQIIYFNRTIDKDIVIEDEVFATKAIYKAELKNGIWTNIKMLPFCNKYFSFENPMISKDGKKLFFSSNCAGTIGGFDIFCITVLDDGSYGAIKNIGDQVNTVNDEKFPFLDDNSVLYFASNGHQGMGGFDIFNCFFIENNFQNVLNLGATINSNLDDFSYFVDVNFDQGFLSSNREGLNNLYSFKRIQNEMNFKIQGCVVDKNNKKVIYNPAITLIDKNGTKISQSESSNSSEFIFKVKPNSNYMLKVVSNDFYPFESEITTYAESKVRYQVELFKILE